MRSMTMVPQFVPARLPRVWYSFFKHVLIGPWLRVLFRPWTEGMDHVPETGSAILASNHLSFSDSFFLPLMAPRQITFLAKAEYFTGKGIKGLISKAFFTGVGQVPIDRSSGRASEAAINTGVRVLREGHLLGIYPEGTRSPDGRLYRGKTGPVRMALEAGAPIVPVGIIGSDVAMPQDRRVIRRAPITLRFGEPLDLSRYRDRREDPLVLRSATDELMYEIMRLSGQQYVDEYAAHVKSGDVDPDEAPPLPPQGTLNALTEWDVTRRPGEAGPFDGDEGEGQCGFT